MASPSDRLLLEATLLGDAAAFETLYRRYRHIVYAYALDSLREVDSAETVVQDTFLTLWTKLPQLGAPLQDLRSWLLVTAENFCRNAARRAGRHREMLDIADYATILVEPDTDTTHDLLRRIGNEVRLMPSLDRALFHSLVVDGRSYEEVARALHLTLGATKMRMRRIRTRLRTTFEGDLP